MSSNRDQAVVNLGRPVLLGFLSGAFAFLLYGGWGYWINLDAGHAMASTVFLAQGSYSFGVTWVATLIIEATYYFVYQFKITPAKPDAAIDLGIAALSCAPVFVGSWVVNMAVATPHILATVALGYVFGAIYAVVYVRGLSRRFSKAASA